MSEQLGLRERKKLQMQQTLWRTAMRMVVERGFDQVSVAEIALAAEVSKMTVFNYYPTKEDLVMSPIEDHLGESARAIRDREPGESATAALHRHFIAKLNEFDPATGLNDLPHILDVRRLIVQTPALTQRMVSLWARDQQILAEEFVAETGDRLTSRLAAAQIFAVRTALVTENNLRILAGEGAKALLPEAIANAELGFAQLENGLAGYCTR